MDTDEVTMKIWCDNHSTYYEFDEWVCPECINDLMYRDVRDRVIERLLIDFPNDDDKAFWESKEQVERTIRDSLEKIGLNQLGSTCMFYFDHKTKLLHVSLIKTLDPIRLSE